MRITDEKVIVERIPIQISVIPGLWISEKDFLEFCTYPCRNTLWETICQYRIPYKETRFRFRNMCSIQYRNQ